MVLIEKNMEKNWKTQQKIKYFCRTFFVVPEMPCMYFQVIITMCRFLHFFCARPIISTCSPYFAVIIILINLPTNFEHRHYFCVAIHTYMWKNIFKFGRNFSNIVVVRYCFIVAIHWFQHFYRKLNKISKNVHKWNKNYYKFVCNFQTLPQ